MSYTDAHPRHGAFLANQLVRLVEIIAGQGDKLLSSAGLSMPARAVSSMLLIGERSQVSTADIAKEFNQPHQLVTQRVAILISLGLVDRLDDPSDRRRKTLALTRKGKKELRRLETCLCDAEQAFLDLYREIECDLMTVTQRAMKALASKSILDRSTITQ